MAVVIFGFWNVPGIRHLINPLKLLTIGAHELFHIIAVRVRCVYRNAPRRSQCDADVFRRYYLEVEYYE